MIDASKNHLYPDELCLKYSGYWQKWSRVLFIEKNGPYWLEVNLTPVNPHLQDNWVAQVMSLTLRLHLTSMEPGRDKLFRAVMKNKHSLVFQEVKTAMLRRMPIDVVHRLLNEDFLAKLDWERYITAQSSPTYRGGGIPFALCKVQP